MVLPGSFNVSGTIKIRKLSAENETTQGGGEFRLELQAVRAFYDRLAERGKPVSGSSKSGANSRSGTATKE
jgi:hypothetical protein